MRNSALVVVIGLLFFSLSLMGCTSEQKRLENPNAQVEIVPKREQTKAAYFRAIKENSFQGKIVKLEPNVREEPKFFRGNEMVEEIMVKAECNGKNFYFTICSSYPNTRSGISRGYTTNGVYREMLMRQDEFSFKKFCFDLTPGMPIIILSSKVFEPEKLHERISMYFVYTDHTDIPDATSIFDAINADSTHS